MALKHYSNLDIVLRSFLFYPQNVILSSKCNGKSLKDSQQGAGMTCFHHKMITLVEQVGRGLGG